ncbi:MAG: hypothetical protein ACERKR_11275, partial [Deltaproteobacteria bacterium]
GHMSVSSSFPIQNSMLDVQCSMFILSVAPRQKQLSAYGLRSGRWNLQLGEKHYHIRGQP